MRTGTLTRNITIVIIKNLKVLDIIRQNKRTSLIAQMVKNPPAMQETWVQSLGWEDTLEE